MRYEKFFNTLLFIVMFVVLFSQIIILTPVFNNRSIYTTAGDGADEYGEIRLKTDVAADGVYILQNGEPISSFTNNTAVVVVRNNSVIEIDGSKTNKAFEVVVTYKSENIKGLDAQKVTVDKNITILGRIFLK